MNKSREKTVKSWDDIRHAFDNILQQTTNRYAWHDRIIDRYINGDLSVHVHVAGNLRGVPLRVCLEVATVFTSTVRNADIHSAHISRDEYGKSVLVAVYKGMQIQERLVPSEIRLNILDLVKGTCGDLVRSRPC